MDPVEHSITQHDFFTLFAQGRQVGAELTFREIPTRNLLKDTLEALLADFFLVVDLDPDFVQVRQEFLVASSCFVIL